MNHRYDDDNYSRREREWNRDRDREGRESEWERREGSRSSFHPGGYGFDETDQGRSSGEQSSPYGQREPYSSQSPQDYGGDYSRERGGGRDWGGEGRGYRQSRYSESQYGSGRHGQGEYDSRRQGEYDPRRNWGGRGTGSRSAQGWDDWDRGSPYGDRGRGGRYANRDSPGYRGRGPDDDYGGSRYGGRSGDEERGYARRYGVGYTGSPDFDRDRSFGDDRFTRADEPRYYGTGYYAEGTSAFGGGFGEERWRSHPSSSGWLRDSEQGGRFYGGGRYGQRGERPGFFRRLFNKGPKGYQRSDERLREDISERLMEADNIDSSEVSVQVVSGKVNLEGTVPDRYMKHAIEDLVDACPGVQDIDNRVRVDRTGGYTGVSSASGTTPGSTGTTGMSAGGSYGAGSSTGTTSGPTTGGTGRSGRKDS